MWHLRRSARWAVWFNAWVRGLTPIDTARDEALGDDAAHDVLGLGDSLVPIMDAWVELRRRGAGTAQVALPMPGDPYALAGPVGFNQSAIEAEEAVIFPGTGTGLVPQSVGGGVFWQLAEAHDLRHEQSVAEAEHELRDTLVRTGRELLELDVARWQPEVRAALERVRDDAEPLLPPGYSTRAEHLVQLASRCLDICTLAEDAEHNAVTAAESEARSGHLGRLRTAAIHAVVSACNHGQELRSVEFER